MELSVPTHFKNEIHAASRLRNSFSIPDQLLNRIGRHFLMLLLFLSMGISAEAYISPAVFSQTKTHQYDQVGSTILRTDESGNVIERVENHRRLVGGLDRNESDVGAARASQAGLASQYSAYGICLWKQGDMSTPFLYNGQAGVQTDSNGLLNMRARYYSPYLMRFLNADPIGFSGGSNWFAYDADGNPISLFDPFGLCAERNAHNNKPDF